MGYRQSNIIHGVEVVLRKDHAKVGKVTRDDFGSWAVEVTWTDGTITKEARGSLSLKANLDKKLAAKDHAEECQICARAIQAKRGLIAHHGFQRPGNGWQTQSCFGARKKPYTVSRENIPVYIETLVQASIFKSEYIASLEANEIIFTNSKWNNLNDLFRRYGPDFLIGYGITVQEALNITPEKIKPGDEQYMSIKKSKLSQEQYELESIKAEIARMKNRNEQWVEGRNSAEYHTYYPI